MFVELVQIRETIVSLVGYIMSKTGAVLIQSNVPDSDGCETRNEEEIVEFFEGHQKKFNKNSIH